MDSIKPVTFPFHLIFCSVMILAAAAAPTDSNRTDITTLNHERDRRDVDVCRTSVAPSAMLDLKRMENRGYCHFKVCENKYGNMNGMTRNPDTIYRVICKETTNCKQAYLNMEVTIHKDGVSHSSREAIPAGCIYSVTDPRESTEVNYEKSYVID
jgi:hypothetical protein